jgi:hypothetical protein
VQFELIPVPLLPRLAHSLQLLVLQKRWIVQTRSVVCLPLRLLMQPVQELALVSPMPEQRPEQQARLVQQPVAV